MYDLVGDCPCGRPASRPDRDCERCFLADRLRRLLREVFEWRAEGSDAPVGEIARDVAEEFGLPEADVRRICRAEDGP